MKASILTISLVAASALPLLTGCIERRVYVERPPVSVAPGSQVVVADPPPPSPSEVVVEAPGPAYVWVPGYWSWQGHWVWVGGSWVIAPYPHAVWAGGHWGRRGHSYVWIEGRWR